MYKTASHHHRQGQHLMHALLEKQAGKYDQAFDRLSQAREVLQRRIASGQGGSSYLGRLQKKLYKVEEKIAPKARQLQEAEKVHFPIAGPPMKGYSREAMQGINPLPRRGFKTGRGKPMSREEIFRTLRNDAHSIHAPDGSSYTLDGRGHMVFHGPKGDIQVAGMGTNRQGVPAVPANPKEMRKIMDRISNTQGGQSGWSYTPRGGVAGASKKYYK